MLGSDCCSLSSIVYCIGVLAIASKVIPLIKKQMTGNKPIELLEKNYKKDVVYFYQFPGTATASSMSPFCIKIEAFLRLHKIKFERRDTSSDRGKNELVPFIELNGEQHADSQIIIRMLSQTFNIKSYPDSAAAAIGHAVDRLIDCHTFNLLLLAKCPVADRIVSTMAAANGAPVFLLPLIARIGGFFVGKKMFTRGLASIGIFTESEYKELLRNDLTQLQTILGRQQFLLGNEPTDVDCTALGHFGATYYAIPSARFFLHDLLDSSEFAALKAYLDRTKNRIFGHEFCGKRL